MPAPPPKGASSTVRCGSVAADAQVVNPEVDEPVPPGPADDAGRAVGVHDFGKDREDVDAQCAGPAPVAAGVCRRRPRSRRLGLGHSNSPAGTSTTRRHPHGRPRTSAARGSRPRITSRSLAGFACTATTVPCRVPSTSTTSLPTRSCTKSASGSSTAAAASSAPAELVGGLAGVNALELDQVAPLKRPGAAHFELADLASVGARGRRPRAAVGAAGPGVGGAAAG